MKPDKAKLAAKIEGMKVLNADQKKEVRELVEELIGEKLSPDKRRGSIWNGPYGNYIVAQADNGMDVFINLNGGSRYSSEQAKKLSFGFSFLANNLKDYLAAGGEV